MRLFKLIILVGLLSRPIWAIDTELKVEVDSKKGSSVEFEARGSVIQSLSGTRPAPAIKNSNTLVAPQNSPPSVLTDSETFFKDIGKPGDSPPTK